VFQCKCQCQRKFIQRINVKTSNALYALVYSEHKRFQMLSEFVSANTRITLVVWQRIPHQRTNHRESLSFHWVFVTVYRIDWCTDLFSCTPARVFNKLTYLFTYWDLYRRRTHA